MFEYLWKRTGCEELGNGNGLRVVDDMTFTSY